MARPRATSAARPHTTRALLLRRVSYGESDLVVTLFTEALGRVSALARGARRSQKRFGGSLEPMHTLILRMDERAGAELLALREASLETPRHHLVRDLDRMQAAGRALGWIRRAAPPRTPEPEAWRVIIELLDRLDDESDARTPKLHLAELGLRLLAALGWGLDLQRCVRCGRACESGRAAMIDATRGGLVCRACGGARVQLDGAVRARLASAAAGKIPGLSAEDANVALGLVEAALRAHMDIE